MMVQKNKMKVKVKVTLVIDDFIFPCLHFSLYFSSYIYMSFIFIMLTNLLITHN